MITDIFVKLFTKDPTIKRHFVKSVSWRIMGSIDTAILGFIITGKLSVGVKIGGLELLTKIILYFIHERIWHRVSFGLPASAKRTQKINKRERNLFYQSFIITRKDREQLNNHTAFTIWLTGLPGSGKSTIAAALDEWFYQQKMHSYIIDGDNTRLGINSDLNFTREGRQENIRRVAEICKLFNDAGTIVVSSFISPFEEDRQQAKNIIGENSFIEVFTDASIHTCKQRDKKGLYKLAEEGKIKNFTGINSPYERPLQADIHLNTDIYTPQACLNFIGEWLSKNHLNGSGIFQKNKTDNE
ncbi:MAG: adenylyl-sulfate kinase [Sphingobacteriia bacterium]|nr:adenylyl-sulfate kinase [Sphingobacteriia bacterium]